MSNVAQCPDCKKKYKVPHTDKTWQCKVCQVPLIVQDPVSVESVPKSEQKVRPKSGKLVSTTCPACGATAAGLLSQCKECGEPIGSDPYASPKNSGRPAHRRATAGSRESIEQSAARGAAKKELRKLGFLRFLIVFGLFGSCIEVVMDISLLVKTDGLLLLALMLVLDLVTVWFLWSTHKALASVYGRPRPFVIVLACLYTLNAVLQEQQLFQLITGLFAAIYWMFVATLGKIQAIKDENPEAFADPDQVRSIAADEKLHRRRMAEAARVSKERNRRLVILGGICGVLLLGFLGYKVTNKPDKPDKAILVFQTSWNAGDFAAVASLATPGRRAAWLKKLKNRDKKRGWGGRPPILGTALIESESESSVRVAYPVDDGSLGVRFGLEGKVWVLTSMNYSDFP